MFVILIILSVTILKGNSEYFFIHILFNYEIDTLNMNFGMSAANFCA